MGWPSYKTHHDLINQNRFFCQVLIIKETRGRRWPPLPPSICQSLTADTRGSASRRHTVTASYRRSCTPSPAPQGNVNKGRLVVSRLTSPPPPPPPLLSPLTLRHLWRASLTCLIDRPPKRSQPTRNNIGREGGQRPLCYSHAEISATEKSYQNCQKCFFLVKSAWLCPLKGLAHTDLAGCSYLWNTYFIITFCCFTQVFVDSAYKQLTMALYQARNLLRCNNLSGNLTDDCVNNFMSFFE